jgi:hypothetical protein
LFDESGVIVVSSNKDHLHSLAGQSWASIFQKNATAWHDEIKVFVPGHALLEKFRNPYKSLTAHALLLHVDASYFEVPRKAQLQMIDQMLAKCLLAGSILDSPASLSPLPLMGIPGWWPNQDQNDEFYADLQVFRLPKEKSPKAPIHTCGAPLENVV